MAYALSALLHKAIWEEGLEALNICRRAPEISDLLFVDDTLLFFHARPDKAAIVKKVLNTHTKPTWQLIDQSKCSIL